MSFSNRCRDVRLRHGAVRKGDQNELRRQGVQSMAQRVVAAKSGGKAAAVRGDLEVNLVTSLDNEAVVEDGGVLAGRVLSVLGVLQCERKSYFERGCESGCHEVLNNSKWHQTLPSLCHTNLVREGRAFSRQDPFSCDETDLRR